MSVCDRYDGKGPEDWVWDPDRDRFTNSDLRDISDKCCSDYTVNKRSASPMQWIGIYVAAASLVCSLTMAADVFHGFRHRKLWFPCKFFTLNAAYLTLLGIAMKLPVDLSTNMEGPRDQVAKLTSTIFMSTAIGNFMPSLAAMDDKDIFMNLTALAILIITISVNICIQLITHVIDAFFMVEHIAAVSFMIVLLVISSLSALTVSTTKSSLQLKYDDIHKTISREEESEETKKFTIEEKLKKLKVNVKKYWMMAKSVSPQFVMARSVTCYASGAICLLAPVTLLVAGLRVCILGEEKLHNFGDYLSRGEFGSDYNWSTIVILAIQSFGVLVGTFAPALRCFTTIRLRLRLEKTVSSYLKELKIENYWIERLIGWKERPSGKKIVHITKNLILDFCKRVQIVIVWASKLIMLISFVFIRPFWSLVNSSCKFISGPTEQDRSLSPYVLFLEGEEELPLQLMNNNRYATDHFIKKGEKRQPEYLKELLDKSTVGFIGVTRFDSEKSPNCWSLPVVTLTSIAIALPNIENPKVKQQLLRSVNKGLFYVKLVEKFLNDKSDMVDIIKAAEVVWSGVNFFREWLDDDLKKMASEVKTAKETLERLVAIAKKMKGDQKPLNGSIKDIAANSMYRISQTLLDHEGLNETLFEQLSIMIAYILCACLTNLPRVINMKFFCCGIEQRENSVLHAAQLIGETEEILKILQQRKLPSLDPDKLAYIDEWRALINDGSSSSVPGEVQIAIG